MAEIFNPSSLSQHQGWRIVSWSMSRQLAEPLDLTLLGVNARGFLALRTTFKFTILAAMLKPTNRTKVPAWVCSMVGEPDRTNSAILQPNLVNPRGSISPSVLGYEPSVRACPALRCLEKVLHLGKPQDRIFRFRNCKSLFFWWWDVIFLTPSCLKSFRRSCSFALRLKVCLSPCFTMAWEFNPSLLILTFTGCFHLKQKVLIV